MRRWMAWMAGVALLLVWTGCGGGSSSVTTEGGNSAEGGAPAVQLSPADPVTKVLSEPRFAPVAGALRKMGAETPEAVSQVLEASSLPQVFERLKEVDGTIASETVRDALKAMELRTLFASGGATKRGVAAVRMPESVVRAMEAIDSPYCEIRRSYLRPFRVEDPAPGAEEAFYKAQLARFNQRLLALGKEGVSLEDFRAAVRAARSLRPLFDFVATELQNGDRNATLLSTGVGARALAGSPALFNPVDEFAGASPLRPEKFLEKGAFLYGVCHGVAVRYPMQVSGFSEANATLPALVSEAGGERLVEFNRVGAAFLRVVNRSGSERTFRLDHATERLVEVRVPAGGTVGVTLPITSQDLCVPYRMARDDEGWEIFVERLAEPEPLQKGFNGATGRYEASGVVVTSRTEDTMRRGGVLSFVLYETGGRELNLTLASDDDLGTDYLLVAPDGTMRTFRQSGARLESVTFAGEDGKWLLFVLPSGPEPLALEGGGRRVKNLPASPLVTHFEERRAEVTLPMEAGHLKRFVVGELQSVALSQDGERSSGNPGEVMLSFKTNMAPRLQIGPEAFAAFESTRYALIRCWERHGKAVSVFESNGTCADYRPDFRRLLIDAWYDTNYYDEGDDTDDLPEAPGDIFAYYSDAAKYRILSREADRIRQKVADATLNAVFEVESGIYNNWLESVVQINSLSMPIEGHFNLYDTRVESPVRRHRILPEIQTRIPFFAVTKERMAASTVPLGFKLEVTEDDEPSTAKELFAVSKYIASQVLAAYSGNFVSLVCNNVTLMKELRKIEIEGMDDPLGTADFYANRFSRSDTFYGLAEGSLTFHISGFAEVPDHFTTFDRNLNYAGIACGAVGAALGVYSLSQNVGTLISGDYLSGGDMEAVMAGVKAELLKGLEEGTPEYQQALEAVEQIRNGLADPSMMEILKITTITGAISDGIDVFLNLLDVQKEMKGLAGRGNNVVRSEATFFGSSFDRAKTRARIRMKEVASLPVRRAAVTIDEVTIYNNMEEAGNLAEVRLKGRVGVISDLRPEGVFDRNNSDLFSVLHYQYGIYNGVDDGETLTLREDTTRLLEATFPEGNNMAALFIELDIMEDDGAGELDDDMIGVFATTFYLEDLFNTSEEYEVEYRGGRRWRVHLQRPLYDARHMPSLVELFDEESAAWQRDYNRQRLESPSAMVKLHIDLELGDYRDYPEVDTALPERNATVPVGADLSAMDPHEVAGLPSETNETRLLDRREGRALFFGYRGERDAKEGRVQLVELAEGHRLVRRLSFGPEALASAHRHYLLREREVVRGTFVDENRLLLFFSSSRDGEEAGGMLLIGTEGERVRTLSHIHFDGEGALATGALFLRRREGGVDVAVSFVDPGEAAGEPYRSWIRTYRIEAEGGIRPLKRVEAHGMIREMIAVDDTTLLADMAEVEDARRGEVRRWRFGRLFMRLWRFDDTGEGEVISERDITASVNAIEPGVATFIPPGIWHAGLRNIDRSPYNRLIARYRRAWRLDYLPATDTYQIGDPLTIRTHQPLYRFIPEPETGVLVRTGWRFLLVGGYGVKSERLLVSRERLFHDPLDRHPRLLDADFPTSDFMLGVFRIGRSERLSLVDLYYDGRPEVTGPRFGEEVVMNHANGYRARVPFAVALGEYPLSDYNVSFAILDEESNATLFEGVDTAVLNIDRPETYWYKAKLSCESNGSCALALHYEKPCTVVRHRYRVRVRRRGYETVRTFVARLALTPPRLEENRTLAIGRIDLQERYERGELLFKSFEGAYADPNSCVTRYELGDHPAWVRLSEENGAWLTARVTAEPLSIEDAGSYRIALTAYNAEGSDTVYFTVAVAEPDRVPDPVAPVRLTDVNLSVPVETRIRVTGIDAPVEARIEGGLFSLDDGASWLDRNGTVHAGATVLVRHESAPGYGQSRVTVLHLGSVDFRFESVTMADPAANDATPDPFSFTDLSGVEPGSWQEARMVVSGITVETNLTITGGEYSLDGGATWQSGPATVSNGQEVRVRHRAADGYNARTDTVLNVGGVEDTFTSVTRVMKVPAPTLAAGDPGALRLGEKAAIVIQNRADPADSWRLEGSLPAGLGFSEGNITGTPEAAGRFAVTVVAANAAGEGRLDLELYVAGGTPPDLDGGFPSLDETEVAITFADDADWRAAVRGVTVDVDYGGAVALAEGRDYRIEAGRLLLLVTGENGVPTRSGQWEVRVAADGYDEAVATFFMDPAQVDASETNASFVLTGYPFGAGGRTRIALIAKDRFGQAIPYGYLKAKMRVADAGGRWHEPYRIGLQNRTVTMRANAFHPDATDTLDITADANGSVVLEIRVPGAVDGGDGFDLIFETDGGEPIARYTYRAGTDTLYPDEWRERIGVDFAGRSADGSARYALWSLYFSPDIHATGDGNGTLYLAVGMVDKSRDYWEYRSRASRVGLVAVDRNGAPLWIRYVEDGISEYAVGSFRYERGRLYLGLTTDGNLSSEAGEANSGTYDAALLVLDAADGTTLAARQWGDGTPQVALWAGVEPETAGVLYARNTDADNPVVSRIALLPDGSMERSLLTDLYAFDRLAAGEAGTMIGIDGEWTVGIEAGTERWAIANDGRSPGDEEYNYATLEELVRGEAAFYAMGSVKKGWFDERAATESRDYATLLKRALSGGYLWSRILDDAVEGTYDPVGAVEVGGYLYAAYHAMGPCPIYSDKSCRTLHLARLHPDTGELFGVTVRKTDYDGAAASSHMLEAEALWADAGTGARYLVVVTDGKYRDEAPVAGLQSLVIDKEIPVHAAPADPTGMVRSDRLDLVTDRDRGVQWNDHAFSLSSGDWESAADYCAGLYYDGLGWRLPTLDELASLIDAGSDPKLLPIFAVRDADLAYWSADAPASDDRLADAVDFAEGSRVQISRDETLYIRCLRDLPR